ncbi:MAG: AAA family ATPase [Oligoflexia bacterium]|nr:AAA family ATPase [Oligoflexia bacterium]
MFVGRTQELDLLKRFTTKRTSSMIVISGRRRIGKSTLVSHFYSTIDHFDRFIEIQGLAPHKNIETYDQLKNFHQILCQQSSKKKKYPPFFNWMEAFTALAQECEKGKNLIFLDEISW